MTTFADVRVAESVVDVMSESSIVIELPAVKPTEVFAKTVAVIRLISLAVEFRLTDEVVEEILES